MHSISNFQNRHILSFSVPPSFHTDLSKDFSELSRIHFYLGHSPIDFLVKAVESASAEDIIKGKIQIYFATKEIQEFLYKTAHIDIDSNNSLDTSLFFQKTFDNTLQHTLEVLNNCYKNPTEKSNLEIIEIVLGLTQEIIFLDKELVKININCNISENIEDIKTQYEKIYNLKSHYENIIPLKEFDDYKKDAEISVINQLKTHYEFNYSELAKQVYFSTDDWMPTLNYLIKEREKINQPGYVFDVNESKELKDNFLKQFKSFNQLLNNGVVNYINSFSASISQEIFYNSEKLKVSPKTYFDQELRHYKKNLESPYGNKKDDEKRIKDLESTKEEFIQKKTNDILIYEKKLKILHRQEKTISQSFNKIKANLFGMQTKDTISFEGDITKGFVVGTFSNSEKILLVHKDNFVSEAEAVYAMVLTKEKYQDLVQKNQLVFNEYLRESEFSVASNFWSYGQLLQEISEPSIQKYFLGQEFDLIDNTVLEINNNKKKLKI